MKLPANLSMHDFKMLGIKIGLREKKSMLIDLIDRSSMPGDMRLSAKSIISERIKALEF